MGKSNYETHVATLQKVGVVNVASLRQVDPGQPPRRRNKTSYHQLRQSGLLQGNALNKVNDEEIG